MAMVEKMNVGAVFGDPIREGETILVPVALVKTRFGFGSGYGRKAAKPEDDPEQQPGGGGSGAGAAGVARPLGFIRLGPGGPKFEYLVDATRIAVTALIVGGWTVYWIAKTVRVFVRKS